MSQPILGRLICTGYNPCSLFISFIFFQAHTSVDGKAQCKITIFYPAVISCQLINIGSIGCVADIKLEQVAACINLNTYRKQIGIVINNTRFYQSGFHTY